MSEPVLFNSYNLLNTLLQPLLCSCQTAGGSFLQQFPCVVAWRTPVQSSLQLEELGVPD